MIEKTLKYIVSIELAVILLGVAFRDVEWVPFMEGLKKCDMGLIILSMVAGIFAFWIRGLRWRQLLLPIDSKIGRITTFNGINIANISNFAFPRLGEFVRCGVIVRRARKERINDSTHESKGISYNQVLGTVVLERGWELLVMLLMLALVMLLGYDRFGSFFIKEVWTPMSAKLNMWWIIILAAASGAGAISIIWKFKDTNALCGRIAGVFRGIMQGFSSCLHMKKKWKFFFYTLMIWLTYWFMSACTVWAAPFLNHLDVIDALFLSLAGALSLVVPVPGGIGAFHFIVCLTLTTIYDVPKENALIYATISHTSQSLIQIICGALSYGYEAMKK